ncbi:DEAD/DEAH box helicase [Patescibacteria group bacterium]|nr:DEAD/DEAH box helicase [Patescibacteria group bacterium]MBU4023447.1 DEAD/DEAH box helicase [Patescibacteria group bacterium]MBU4078055.1 DEAD/DEAH box helicase [Patescibacteria group bacterium]
MTQTTQSIGRFCDLGIEENFLSVLTQGKFDIPTPIQNKVIPNALAGKDVVGIAQTGTGKTLAFGIPMIQRIALYNGQGLVIVPTRELAIQVERVLAYIGAPFKLRSVVVIGGASRHSQINALKRNPHIVIATPGRLIDLMDQGVYSLKRVNTITLDEADRMLDIGFLPQIKRILQSAPKERQTMLFSATMPKSISLLASEFMKMPIRIEITPQGTSAENVKHEVFVVRKDNKMRLLDSILQQYQKDTVLVFSRTKHGAKRIANNIRNMDQTAIEIHSNRSQAQRKAALDGFRQGKFRIMVATDIAARGIDVRHISLVINFDIPDNSEDYVHRIGRTGRAGSSGKAISFVTPSQRADIKKVERLIRKSLPILSLPVLPPEREKQHRKEEQNSKKKKYSAWKSSRNHSYQSHGQKSSRNRSNSSNHKRRYTK